MRLVAACLLEQLLARFDSGSELCLLGFGDPGLGLGNALAVLDHHGALERLVCLSHSPIQLGELLDACPVLSCAKCLDGQVVYSQVVIVVVFIHGVELCFPVGPSHLSVLGVCYVCRLARPALFGVDLGIKAPEFEVCHCTLIIHSVVVAELLCDDGVALTLAQGDLLAFRDLRAMVAGIGVAALDCENAL